MEDYAIDLLVRMVKIFSPSGKEEEIAELLYQEMNKLGFEVELDAVGNVIGSIGEERPKLLLCGHMDTVPGYLPVRVEDDNLYGRGTVDAKAPLAAMIIAASHLNRDGYPGSIEIVGAVDEEGKGQGIKQYIKRSVDIDYAIFGEPTNVDTITVGYRGSLHLKITCETETGHSSAPWMFENAVEKTIEIWNIIKDLKISQERPESHFHTLSSCLRQIEGGTSGSVVPSRCVIYIDFRIPPSITIKKLKKEINRLIEEYQIQNPHVKIKTEVEDQTEAYLSNKRSPPVRALSRAIWKIRGTKAILMSKTGTGDMNVFGHATDVPTVTYGPGDSHLDHTPNEHISLKDYLESIEVLKEAIKVLYELHQKIQSKT